MRAVFFGLKENVKSNFKVKIMQNKINITSDIRKMIEMYGVKTASKFYDLNERSLRHYATKLGVQLPSNETVAENTVKLLSK